MLTNYIAGKRGLVYQTHFKFSDKSIKFLLSFCPRGEHLHGILEASCVVCVELQEWGQSRYHITQTLLGVPTR